MDQLLVTLPLAGRALTDVVGVQVVQADYTHELAIINVWGITAEQTQPLMSGSPVLISWSTKGSLTSGTFLGYFDHSIVVEGGMSYVCVGASYPMKTARQQVWENVTADQLAAQIADRYRLNTDLDSHYRIFPTIAQAGESDWELLVRMAKTVGYSCFVRHTTLHFHPRGRDFDVYRAWAPAFSVKEISGFRPTLGDAPAGPGSGELANRQLTVLDSSGQVSTVTSGLQAPLIGGYQVLPNFTRINTTPVDTVADAQSQLDAERELNRWHVTAEATLPGDIRLRPGMPVVLTDVPGEWLGAWVVLTAEHRIKPGDNYGRGREYFVRATLGRDSRGISPGQATPPPVTAVGYNGVVESSSARLLNGMWVAPSSVAYAPIETSRPQFVLDRLAP